MENKKLVINSEKLLSILGLYVFSIFFLDYSIVFKFFAFILLVLSLLVYKVKLIKWTPYIKCELLFIGYIFLHTLFFSVDKSKSFSAVATVIINFCISICIIRIMNSKEKIEKIMKIAIISSLVATLYIIGADFHNLFSGNLGENVNKLLGGGTYSHNDVSGIAAVSILFLSYFEVKSRKKNRSTLLLKIFFLCFIVLTGARKSLILGICGMFIYPTFFVNEDKNMAKQIIKLFIGCIILLLFMYAIMNNSLLYNLIGKRFEGYFAGIETGEYTESSARTRQVMKEAIINLIKQKPFMGYGINTFQNYKGSYGVWSHNNYLELWFACGIFTLVIYYIFCVKAIIGLYKNRKDLMGGMLLLFMLYMLIHDYLSVSYLSRLIMLMYCIVDVYLGQYKIVNESDMLEEKN